jgi:hypothetical protein
MYIPTFCVYVSIELQMYISEKYVYHKELHLIGKGPVEEQDYSKLKNPDGAFEKFENQQ